MRPLPTLAAALAAALLAASPARAAVTALDAWTNLLTNTNPGTTTYTTTTTNSITVSAGTNRVMLAGVCLEASTGGVTVSSIDVRLDSATGAQFTQIARSAGSQREHCYLGRLLDAQIAPGSHTIYLNTTISANTITGVHIWAGTYQGVDQPTPVSSSAANNSNTAAVTFGTAVSYNANSMTVYITAAGNTATAVTHVSGFTSVGTSWSTDQSTSIAQATNAGAGSYAAGSQVSWTASARSAIAVASLNPVTVAPPGAPGTPTYSNIATTSVTVSWTPATGATSYNLQRATDSGFTQNLTTLTGVTSPYADAGPLTGNTTYWYRAVAVNAGGTTTGPSSSVLTLPDAPGTPTYTNLAATTVTVSWTPSAGGAASYDLQRATDAAFTANLVTRTNVTSPYNDTGLAAGTTYWYRVVAVNASGSTTGGSSSVVYEVRVIPAAPTAAASSCSQVTVRAPFAGDANGDSTTAVSRGTAPGGPFPTAVCANLSGASPRTCNDGTVAALTTYYYQVVFTDADGVNGAATQVVSVTTPVCVVNDTTAGALSAQPTSCNSITASATFTGDDNGNGTTLIEYNTTNTWPGTAACAAASGASPRQCVVGGLAGGTTYWFRATFADPDGVSGTNPTAAVSAATPACGADTTAPTLTMLVPGRNAILSGADNAKVQVFDAGGLATTNPVRWQVDGTAAGSYSATGVTVNASYACGTGCGVYEIAVPAQAAGSHYLSIRATDAAGNNAYLNWAFRARAAGAGSGSILRRTHGSQLCLDCHNLQTHNSQYTSTTYGNWSVDCQTCHTPHGTANIFLVRGAVETPASGVKAVDFRNTTGVAANSYATPTASGNGVNVCEVCHTRTKNGDGTARSRSTSATDWAKHYAGRCTDCHAHSRGFFAFESDGSFTCASCHRTIWDGMTGGVAKSSRHALGNILGTNDAFDDTAVTWGNPLSANAPAVRSCVNTCHNDHPHTLTSPATATHENNVYMDATSQASRAATTRTSADKDRTDFQSGQANGGLCLSCHRNPVDAARPAVDKAAYASSAHNYTTFGAYGAWQYTQHDGSTFLRNCTKCHSDRGDTRPGANVIPFGAVHFSDYPSLLAGSTNPSGTPGTFVCYNCHGNGTTGTNYSGKAIATQIAKTRNHPSDADSVHDSVTEFNNAAFGNTLGVTGRHASCLDCHETHEAKAGTHATPGNLAGPPLEGAWGAQLSSNPAFWTDTASGNFTKKTIVAGTDAEATLCFKCHTRYYWGASTPPTSPSGGFAETDVGKEFNPDNTALTTTGTASFTNNSATVTGSSTSWTARMVGWMIKRNSDTASPVWYRVTAVASATSLTVNRNYTGTSGTAQAYTLQAPGGFHPILATAGNNLGAVRLTNLVTTSLAWSTTARNVMTCTDCHESDTTTDPGGPHGSTASYLLRGPNTTWNGTIAVNNNNAWPAGTFCANCHSNTYANSRFPDHGNGSHNVACWNCHSAVPHGGPRPGMLIAPAGVNTTNLVAYSDWDTAAPYWGLGTSGDKLYIVRYPATNTTNWAQSDCGCNGSGH